MPAGNPQGYGPQPLSFDEAQALVALREAPAVFAAGHLARPERRDVLRTLASRAKGLEGFQPLTQDERAAHMNFLRGLPPDRLNQILGIIQAKAQGPFARDAMQQMPEDVFKSAMLQDALSSMFLG